MTRLVDALIFHGLTRPHIAAGVLMFTLLAIGTVVALDVVEKRQR